MVRRARRLVAWGLAAVCVLGAWLWREVRDRAVLVAPAPTLLVEDVRGRFLAGLGPGPGHGYWPPGARPPERVVRATLAAEDARFERHPGVDPWSVGRALYRNARHLKVVQGASTLAMQVARLQSPGRRSLARKILEALVAVRLTALHGRDAILGHYLTIAPYGNQYHGIAYAARQYFDKPIEDLTWAEAALLASLPRMPGRMSLHGESGRRRAFARARYVLGRLRELGWIPVEELDTALAQLPSLGLAPRRTRPGSCLHAILQLGAQARARRLTGRGRTPHLVRTTIDLDVQSTVSRIAANSIGELRADGAGNAAVVVIEKDTGAIVAYLGSAGFDDRENRGSIDYARVPRSPGSALKPFIYGLAMSLRGFTGATVLSDVGLLLDSRRGGYRVENYDGGQLGPILLRNALANSRNIPAAEVLQAVGVEAAYEHLRDLGLVHGWNDPRQYGLSLVLGALHVSLVDLVRAYGTLAREGISLDLTWTREAGRPGRGARVIPEDVARQITRFLSDPMARLPSFPRMGWLEYPFPVAVKTGTSQGFRDAWCVAYSQRYVVGAWVGHADNAPMKRRCGADSAAAIVHRIMETLHPEDVPGLSDLAFPPPRGWVARRIDMLSGKAARDDTPYVAVEWFGPGTEPVELTDVYRDLTVDAATGRPAGPDCPLERRLVRRCVALDPRYARWARASGLELAPLAGPGPGLRQDPELSVLSPRDGARLLGDPETPRDRATIALEANVSPPAPQVVWYVDGRHLCVADYPYTTRWRLSPGEHLFQIGLPYARLRSPGVRVTITD